MASSRLMKEIKELRTSAAFRNGDFTVDMVDDSIYEWNVELRAIDKDSKLYKDMITWKEKDGEDHILLNFTFNDKYPLEPPFVRLVHPHMNCKNFMLFSYAHFVTRHFVEHFFFSNFQQANMLSRVVQFARNSY